MALREINLIPEDVLMRHHRSRHLYFWAMCFTISLALIFGSHLYYSHARGARLNPGDSLKDADSLLASKITEVTALQGKLETLQKKRSAFEAITLLTGYSRILAALSGVMNDETWLTAIALQEGTGNDGGVHMQITGFSLDNEELGGFLDRLSFMPVFENVVLRYAAETKTKIPEVGANDLSDLIQFEILCHVARS